MKRYLLAAVVLVTLVLALTFPVAVPAAPPPQHHHIREAMAALRRLVMTATRVARFRRASR